ncbi:MAG: cell shape determination protein CcmA [Acidobacteria bacterium]|nr:MAG: cell shape determination protein CcmA [Acidobacteriota bacterium]PIE88944.1 MAG: cell shape determination protein CcmA [Acidobacteriota bacterium]
MGLFGGKNNDNKPVRTEKSSVGRSFQRESHLGTGTQVEGTLSGSVPIVIDGSLKGEIKSAGNVTIGKEGKIEAEVKCQSIVIEGEVIGKVYASEKIRIESTGALRGDIETKSFVNQPGGFFEGYSHMVKEKNAKKKND